MTMKHANNNNDDNNLEERLCQWRKEQEKIASSVITLQHPIKPNLDKDCHYKLLNEYQCSDYIDKLYGGVDISFPEEGKVEAVGAYVIMNGRFEVLYRDYIVFPLTIPYVSSYLSFREIEPYEKLIQKQKREQPNVTPDVILVDGNGILHERMAGIACFVGVRTGIKTIGVAKSMYHHDGLHIHMIQSAIPKYLHNFVTAMENRSCLEQSVVLDCSPIDAGAPCNDSNPEDKITDDIMTHLSKYCQSFAIQLKGKSGRIWGAALIGHGGHMNPKKDVRQKGTKNPIFISIGHLMSLEECIYICSFLSKARIPEPVREADLFGRDVIRKGL